MAAESVSTATAWLQALLFCIVSTRTRLPPIGERGPDGYAVHAHPVRIRTQRTRSEFKFSRQAALRAVHLQAGRRGDCPSRARTYTCHSQTPRLTLCGFSRRKHRKSKNVSAPQRKDTCVVVVCIQLELRFALNLIHVNIITY
jgi:hypothetical protein